MLAYVFFISPLVRASSKGLQPLNKQKCSLSFWTDYLLLRRDFVGICEVFCLHCKLLQQSTVLQMIHEIGLLGCVLQQSQICHSVGTRFPVLQWKGKSGKNTVQHQMATNVRASVSTGMYSNIESQLIGTWNMQIIDVWLTYDFSICICSWRHGAGCNLKVQWSGTWYCHIRWFWTVSDWLITLKNFLWIYWVVFGYKLLFSTQTIIRLCCNLIQSTDVAIFRVQPYILFLKCTWQQSWGF